MLGSIDVAGVEQGGDFCCDMGGEVDLRAKRNTGFFFLVFPGCFVAARFLLLRVLNQEHFSFGFCWTTIGVIPGTLPPFQTWHIAAIFGDRPAVTT